MKKEQTMRKLIGLLTLVSALMAGEAMARTMTVKAQGQTSVTLEFGAPDGKAYQLCLASGPTDGGDRKRAWENWTTVATVAADQEIGTYEIPPALLDGRLFRFFLMQTADLPYATERDSVRATGAQWVDTGIVPTSLTEVEFDFGNVVYEHNDTLFGQGYAGNNYLLTTQNGRFMFYGLVNKAGITLDTTIISNMRYVCRVTSDNSLTLSHGNVSNHYSINRGVSSGNLAVFGTNGGSYLCACTFYGMRITKDGSMLRDFLPVADAAGNGCLYDMISGTLFTSKTSTPLVSGTVCADRLGRVLATTPSLHGRRSIAITAQTDNAITLGFGNADGEVYTLFLAAGQTDGGSDKRAWTQFTEVTDISAAQTSYTYQLPDALKADGMQLRFFLMKSKGLPYAKELASITSTGYQWIPTDYVPTRETGVDIRFGDVVYANNTIIFGQAFMGSCYMIALQDRSSQHCFMWYGQTKQLDNTVLAETDYRARVIPGGTVAMSHGGGVETVYSAPFEEGFFNPLYIFGSPSGYFAKFRLDSMLITECGAPVRDFVPVEDLHGKGALFDRVYGRLHSNESATEFVKGADLDTTRTGWVVAQTGTFVASASKPVTATWVGLGDRANVADPLNWRCYNAAGMFLEGAVPTAETTVRLEESTTFNIPDGAAFACRAIEAPARVTLTTDCDWRGFDLALLPEGLKVDLAGHRLVVCADSTADVLDLANGAETTGELVLEVPAEATYDNAVLTINGAVKFVKDGAGVVAISKHCATVTEAEVRAGTLKFNGGRFTLRPFTLSVKSGATCDLNGKGDNTYTYEIEGTGVDGRGAIVNGGSISSGTAQAAGLVLTGDARIWSKGHFGLINSSYTATTLELNGYTLTLDYGDGAGFWIANATGASGGTIRCLGGCIPYPYKNASSIPGVEFVLEGSSIFRMASGSPKCTIKRLVLNDGTTLEENSYLYAYGLEMREGARTSGGSWFYIGGPLIVSNETQTIEFSIPTTDLSAASPGSVVKYGAGTFKFHLNYTANSFTGGTYVHQGKMIIDSIYKTPQPWYALGNPAGPLFIGATGELDMTACGATALSVASLETEAGATLTTTNINVLTVRGDATIAAGLATAGSLVLNGETTLDLTDLFAGANPPVAGQPVTLVTAKAISGSGVYKVKGSPYATRIVNLGTSLVAVFFTGSAGEAVAAAKPIRLWCVGDDLVRGTATDNFRGPLARLLALDGWDVKMTGFRTVNSGAIPLPTVWSGHTGLQGAALRTSATRPGLLEGLDTYAAAAEEPDFTIFLCGKADLADGIDAATVLANWQEAVTRLKAALPMTTVVALALPGESAFNAQARTWAAANGVPFVSGTETALATTDAEGFSAAAAAIHETLASLATCAGKNGAATVVKIRNALARDGKFLAVTYSKPLTALPSTPTLVRTSDSGAIALSEATLSNDGRTVTYALAEEVAPKTEYAFTANGVTTTFFPRLFGALNNVPDAYTTGYVRKRVFEADATYHHAQNLDRIPYTFAPLMSETGIARVGYYIELVRADTGELKTMWIDMAAPGSNWADVALPVTPGQYKQQAVSSLHVWSDFGGVKPVAANDDSVEGFIEFSPLNLGGTDPSIDGAPAEVWANQFGFVDTFNKTGTGGYGSFQLMRKFPAGTVPSAEILFSYTYWGNGQSGNPIWGMGSLANYGELNANKSIDWTFITGTGLDAISGAAYSVRRIEFWLKYDGAEDRASACSLVWTGENGGDFQAFANWRAQDDSAPTTFNDQTMLLPANETPIAFSYQGVDMINCGYSMLVVDGSYSFPEVGGLYLKSLDLGPAGRLTYDPTRFALRVDNAPVFASGAKLALAPKYANATKGRFLLLTWDRGGFDSDTDLTSIFDTTSAKGANVKVWAEKVGNGGRLWVDLDFGAPKRALTIMPVGDSITQGYMSTYGNWRTLFMKKLAAAGYEPHSTGFWKIESNDICGATMPEDWIWHAGISAQRTLTKGGGGTLDAIEALLDQAGDVDFVVVKLGTNDVGADGSSAQEAFDGWTNLVFKILSQKPHAKVIASSILDQAHNASAEARVIAFNAAVSNAVATGVFPAGRVYFADVYTPCYRYDVNGRYIPGSFYAADNVHPDWPGEDKMADVYLAAIERAVAEDQGDIGQREPMPTTTGSLVNVPEIYRAGFKRARVYDILKSPRLSRGMMVPYEDYSQEEGVTENLGRVGYYIELKRKNTSLVDYRGLVRWLWVDVEAFGNRDLASCGIPIEVSSQMPVNGLHVVGNMPGIEAIAPDDDSQQAFVEFWPHGYSGGPGSANGAPPNTYGCDWNDVLSANTYSYGSMQIHRMTPLARNPAQVLFAFNRWTVGSGELEIGLGNFSSVTLGSVDWTFTGDASKGYAGTMSAAAYEIARIEIWTKELDMSEILTAEWTGAGEDPTDWSDPANWRAVNRAGETLAAVPQAITDVTIRDSAALARLRAGAFVCRSVTVGGSHTLAADWDWRNLKVAFVEGTSIDLKGHKLYISPRIPEKGSCAITDSTAGLWPASRFYRVKVEGLKLAANAAPCEGVQLAEIKLFDAAGQDVTASKTRVFCDTTTTTANGLLSPDGQAADNAFDGSIYTKWTDYRAGTQETAEVREAAWAAVEFPEPVALSKYELHSGDGPDAASPYRWRFQSSTDGVTWTDLDVVSVYVVPDTRNGLLFTGLPGTTVLDSNTVAPGELHLVLNDSLTTSKLVASGHLKVLKEGVGIWHNTAATGDYSGGLEIAEGTYRGYRTTFPDNGNRTVVVRAGATLDTDAHSGSVLNGTVSRVALEEGSTLLHDHNDASTSYTGFHSLFLTGDAAFNVKTSCGFISTAYRRTFIDLGGHTLNLSVASAKTFSLYNTELTAGKVVNANSGFFAFGSATKGYGHTGVYAPETDFDLRSALQVNCTSIVHSLTVRWPDTDYGSAVSNAYLFVRGTLAPLTSYHVNFRLMDGATLDLSTKSNDWSLTAPQPSSLPAEMRTITFEDGAKIKVDLGPRRGFGAATKIVDWSTCPPENLETLKFGFGGSSAGRGGQLVAREDGLYFYNGFVIHLR